MVVFSDALDECEGEKIVRCVEIVLCEDRFISCFLGIYVQ